VQVSPQARAGQIAFAGSHYFLTLGSFDSPLVGR